MEVLASDNERHEIKKGYDCLVRLKNPDDSYKRKENGYIIQDWMKFKFDLLSEQTGNVAVDLDSIEKSTASIWIYGLPEGNQIHVYSMLLSDLASYGLEWPIIKSWRGVRYRWAWVD